LGEQVERKLTAILAADIAGYSRLMVGDEEGTLSRLKSHRRELIDSKIKEYRGRIIKTTGDGMLVEFPSVVDAVRCAVDIQRGMATRNEEVVPDRRIDFRVGINVGDVIVDGDDIYGLAPSERPSGRSDRTCRDRRMRRLFDRRQGRQYRGAIGEYRRAGRHPRLGQCARSSLGQARVRLRRSRRAERQEHPPPDAGLSGAAWRWRSAVRNTPICHPGESRGPSLRKRVWLRHGLRLSPERGLFLLLGMAALVVIGVIGIFASGVFQKPSSPLGGERGNNEATENARHLSIVVLPFTNLSSDAGQDYFADGITENLTTDLSRIRNSFVIARNTVFTFKGKNIDAKAIGKELGVRYVLEGSVQRDGNRVRVNAQLIDAETGAHLWADRFEDDLADLFKLQDDVVARLANTLSYELMKAEAAKSAHSTNPDAIDLTMRGWALYWDSLAIDKATSAAALNLFERALEVDPNNDDALTGTAYINFRGYFFGWGDSASIDNDAKIIAPCDRAIALNPLNAKAYYVKSIYLSESKRSDDAFRTAEMGLSSNSSFPSLYFARALAEVAFGRFDSARADIAQAMKLSPRDPQMATWQTLLGGVEIAVGNDNAAIEDEKKQSRAATGMPTCPMPTLRRLTRSLAKTRTPKPNWRKRARSILS
jgi:adenylate cyclase